MSWDKIKALPFGEAIIKDLKGIVVQPVLRDTQHATLLAEGRRELAIELLLAIGDDV